MEMVPCCEVRLFAKSGGSCRCCSPPDVNLRLLREKCGSGTTKSLLIIRSLWHVRSGLLAWLLTAWNCLCCLLGYFGCYCSLER